MTDEIIVGFDCCRDYEHPERPPRIYPRKTTMSVGESINLYLRVVHPDCYESCYTWKVLSGGGFLDPEVGIQTYYHAPSENEECQSSPVIECRCPRGRIEKIYIAVNGFPGSDVAYLDIQNWNEGYIIEDYKPVKRPPPEDLFAGLTPTYGTLTFRYRACDRRILATRYLGLVQQPRTWYQPKYGLMPGRWFDFYILEGKNYWTREYGPTYERAQYWVLRAHIGFPLKLTTPKGETLDSWYPWYRFWTEATEPAIGTNSDVRSKGMIENGCCNYDLIEQE